MPTDTSDQQITMPVDADSADNPVAFVNGVADIENRLVRRYTNLADRTARMAVLAANAISTLTTEARIDAYDGSNHVSLFRRSLFASPRMTAAQNLTISNTTLQSITSLVAAMPTAGTFDFRGIIYYTSAAAADIKFAFLLPAGATILWNGPGVVVGGTGTGDTTATTAAASDAVISYAGNGVGVVLACQIEGTYVAGGTAGNLQFRAAQNTSDPTQSTIAIHSRIDIWRSV
jgi:hypothetical protein